MTTVMFPPPAPAPVHDDVPWAARNTIRTVVETLLTRRALHQVRVLFDDDAYFTLTRHVDLKTFVRASVGPISTQMPHPHAVEAFVRVRLGARTKALVLRLDYSERWRCTDLRLLGA